LSARVVAEVMTRRASQIDRLVPQAESLAHTSGVPRADALDAIERATIQGLGVDQASQLLHGHEGDPSRGPPRDTSGDRGPPSSHGQNGAGHGKGS
jgi:hypothetical protein